MSLQSAMRQTASMCDTTTKARVKCLRLASQSGAREPAALWTANGAPTPVVARSVGLDTTVGKCAPDCHHNGGRDDGTDEWDAAQLWLARDVKVEQSNHQKNGEESSNDRTQDAAWRTSVSNQLTYYTYDGCDNDPNE